MHEYTDTEWRRQFDPNRPSGAELTLGSIGKISGAVAEARENIAKTEAAIRDLNRRLDALEKTAAPAAPLLIREAQP